ncbi:hypothetical protein SCANM124S_05409 [Streptomyces canus]
MQQLLTVHGDVACVPGQFGGQLAGLGGLPLLLQEGVHLAGAGEREQPADVIRIRSPHGTLTEQRKQKLRAPHGLDQGPRIPFTAQERAHLRTKFRRPCRRLPA